MKFNLNVNQKAVIEAGIKGIDIIDLVLFDVLCDAIMHGGLDTECIDGKQWTWVAYTLMQDELPLLDLSTQTFYRRLNKLCDAGLIQKSPTNEDARKVFICLGKKAKLITSDRHNPYKNEGSGPFKNEGTTPYKNEGTPPTNLEGYNTTINNTTNKSNFERETHAREEEKPIALEQPQIKNESLDKPKFTTLDIPTCEGHKIKIGVHEYPQQKQGIPFIHPDLIDRIPIDKRIDLWWSLYGIRQSEIKVESEMIQAGLADNETFAKIYRHTFLYVAVTDERFRVPPVKYWKNRTWTDDIVDRRDKKTPTDNTGVAITNAPPAKNWIEREMDEIRRLKEWDKEEQKRWDEKIRLENEAKAANGGNAK